MNNLHTIPPISPSFSMSQRMLSTIEPVFFQKGVIGFDQYRHFSLQDDQHTPYSFLSAVDNSMIRFLLYKLPWDFYPTKDLVEGLIYERIDAIDDVIYSVVSLEKEQPTLNLRAPLVRKDETMWQIVLSDAYAVDYPLDSL